MLVLTRKTGEEILIAENIRVVIIRLKNGSVQIGIDAPREINVCRAELADISKEPTHA
jgi:carbon storage regulator